VSAPIVYVQRSDFASLELGEISGPRAATVGYQGYLDEVMEQGYARLLGV
jgi:hypothetical protein